MEHEDPLTEPAAADLKSRPVGRERVAAVGPGSGHVRSDETTGDLFRERNTRAARRIPRELWRVVQRKLKLLDGAARLDDLVTPAGN